MGVFQFEGIVLEEAPKEVVPKCPHCHQVLHKLWVKVKGCGVVEQKQIIICPACECFLGFGTFSV